VWDTGISPDRRDGYSDSAAPDRRTNPRRGIPERDGSTFTGRVATPPVPIVYPRQNPQ
jgi:hypothetical protein